MRVFFNEDWMHFLLMLHSRKCEVNADCVRSYIRSYQNSDITDFVFNVNGTVSSSPSAVFETWSDKYLKKTENGMPVDFKDSPAAVSYRLYAEQNTDVYAVWIEEVRKMNIRPWLSFRMNDVHGTWDGRASLRKAEIIEQRPDWWISGSGDHYGTTYFDKALNYAVPEVRQLYFDYIKEQLERYDVSGVELDFTREPYCFSPGAEREGMPIMADFVHRIRELTRAVGERRKKTIELSILCPPTPETNCKLGFDIISMARAGDFDYVVASPRWETINNDIPVEVWKAALGGSAAFGCMLQMLVGGHPKYPPRAVSMDMAFGQVNCFLSRGADFVYLYNYFLGHETGLEAYLHPTAVRQPSNNKYVLEHLADYCKHDRRYPVTYDDFRPIGYMRPFCQLPAVMQTGTFYTFRIPVGKEKAGTGKYLIFKTDEDVSPESFLAAVNGRKAVFRSDGKADPGITPPPVFTFAFDAVLDGDAVVSLRSDRPVTVEFMEILAETE